MEYEAALSKAWSDLERVAKDKNFSVSFLSYEYKIDLDKKSVCSLSCNTCVPGHIGILILHFLVRKLKGLPLVRGEWISFKQLDGGLPYYPVFKKRVIGPIVEKYGSNPQYLLALEERFRIKKINVADASIVLDVFDNVPVLITLWNGNEEFGPRANMLFDSSIKDIFCTEDVVVLGGIVASVI